MQEYRAHSKSRWAKKRDQQRPRVSSQTLAAQLMSQHTREESYRIVDNHVRGLERVLAEGAPIEGFTGKDIRRNLGVYRGALGLLKKGIKELPGGRKNH